MTEIPMISQGSPTDSDEQLDDGRPARHRRGGPHRGRGRQRRPRGVDGEVRVKGPMVTKGYTNPELTAEAFDDDGYFKTGDVGTCAPTATSCPPGGSRTSSSAGRARTSPRREIEDLARTRTPAARRGARIGLPDRERGERVCAVVERPAEGESHHLRGALSPTWASRGSPASRRSSSSRLSMRLPRNETLRKVLKYQLQRPVRREGLDLMRNSPDVGADADRTPRRS